VSTKTVSRVLNDERGVRPDTAARVAHAIRLLHYRPDGNARLLRLGTAVRAKHAVAIGLLVRDLTDPCLAGLVRSAEATAAEHGVVVLTASSAGDPDKERDLALMLHARGVDALVIMPTASDYAFLAKQIAAGLAVMFVGPPPAGIGMTADTIVMDEIACLRLGVEHLHHQGHRRIAYLSAPPRTPVEDIRLSAYRRVLSTLGLAVDEQLIAVEPPTAARIRSSLSRILDASRGAATALLAGDSLTTLSVLRRLIERDVQQAVRPALVALEDFAFADAIVPGITVVTKNLELIGRTAIDHLLQRLADETGPYLPIEIPPTLIPRGSGELPPT
jgi:LacI family transcriptional regulator